MLAGRLLASAIRSQLQQSVNRGRFSEPIDVLFSEDGRFDGLGVIRFQVGEIPPEIAQPDGPAFIFFPKHMPEDDNYAHSEIWCDHKPATGGYRRPGRTVSGLFREKLCSKLTSDRIVIEAMI